MAKSKLLKLLTVLAGSSAAVPDLSLPTTDRLYYFYGGNGVTKPSGITSAGDGSAVSSWADMDSQVTLAQAGGTEQPTYRLSVAGFNNRGAVEFDGGDYLFASDTAIPFLSDWTWGMVVKSSHSSGGTIASEGNNPDNNPFLRFDTTTNKVIASVRSNAGASASVTSTAVVGDGAKHLIVMRHDNTAKLLYLYVDDLATPNVQVSTAALGATTFNRMCLGALYRSSAGEIWDGQIALSVAYSGNHVSDLSAAKTHYGIS